MIDEYAALGANSGGRITCEYAVARGRTDLLIEWPLPGQAFESRASKHAIECKVVGEHSGLETIVREGLRHAVCMDLCGAESGHLLVVDLPSKKAWAERIFRRDPEPGRALVTVRGM